MSTYDAWSQSLYWRFVSGWADATFSSQHNTVIALSTTTFKAQISS